MCSIFGFSGNFERSLLNASIEIQNHRGPDSNGIWHDPKSQIGLAHNRLAIIDLSPLAHQPMKNSLTNTIISFNGEIYNFQELKKDLLKNDYLFKSNSDTEVLLIMYEKYGTDMLQYLNGIFAFAIWDPKRELLFLARDQYGVKPLYYTENSKGFLFASELKALLLEPSISKKIDTQSLHYYMSFLWSPAPNTFLKNIKKCEAGHAMLIKNNKIYKKWRYYDIPYEGKYTKDSELEIINHTKTLLNNSIKRQLVSDVPVGAFLSGGVDSSTIVAIASKYNKNPINCFTINLINKDSNEGFEDDFPYAKKVASYLNVPLHNISVKAETLYTYIEKMIYHLDEPQADPAPINAYLISELAKKHNIKVLLSGAGGDDIFSGYRRHQALQLDSYLNFIPQSLRNKAPTISNKINPSSALKRRLKKYLENAHLNSSERIASYFLWQAENTTHNLYTNEIQKELSKSTAIERLVNSLENIPHEHSQLNKMLYIDTKHFLTDHNLNYTDKMGMGHGVEVRVPFLDPDLVSYCAQIPPQLKQKNNTGKYILKKIASEILPKEIIYRSKSGFGAPLRLWMNSKPFQEMKHELLNKESIEKRGLFEYKKIKSYLKNSNNSDNSYGIFSMMCIELWCKNFLDADTISK